MEADELMIGNYVMFEKEIHQIHCIAEDSPFLKTDKFGVGVVTYDNIKPIPLTEKWLIDFGFEKVIEGCSGIIYNIYGLTVDFDHESEILNESHKIYIDMDKPITKLKYVHQLQNLYFALTGEQLKLK